MSQPDLEAALFALGDQVEWPPTPAFTMRAGRRLPRWRLAVLLAAAAILLLGAAALAGGALIRSVDIQRVPRLASPPATVSPAPDPLRLGDRYATVAAAEKAAGFQINLPAGLGPPAELRVRHQPVAIVTAVYEPTASIPPSSVDPSVGLLLTEYRGSGDSVFIQKLAGPETRIQRVTVAGATGVWLEGSPHQVLVAGQVDAVRLATNTLIWERGGVTYRLEASIGEPEALRLAGTVG